VQHSEVGGISPPAATKGMTGRQTAAQTRTIRRISNFHSGDPILRFILRRFLPAIPYRGDNDQC
jgi:hypothetical protein